MCVCECTHAIYRLLIFHSWHFNSTHCRNRSELDVNFVIKLHDYKCRKLKLNCCTSYIVTANVTEWVAWGATFKENGSRPHKKKHEHTHISDNVTKVLFLFQARWYANIALVVGVANAVQFFALQHGIIFANAMRIRFSFSVFVRGFYTLFSFFLPFLFSILQIRIESNSLTHIQPCFVFIAYWPRKCKNSQQFESEIFSISFHDACK